jgi:O-antigen/teichoic acid export membrane protein
MVARFLGPESVGITSTIVSVAWILSNVVVFDTHLGMKRYLGMSVANKDMETFNQILIATIIFVTFTLSICIIVILIPDLPLLNIIGLGEEHLGFILLIIPASSFQLVFSEALIAGLESKKLLFPQLIGSIIRYPILFTFIFIFYMPILGVVLAYSSLFITTVLLYGIHLYKFSNMRRTLRPTQNLFTNTKKILSSGLSSWGPRFINFFGSQISTIVVFSIGGAIAAGIFYLPMAIFTYTLFIVSSINRVGHSLVAGMKTNKQQTDFVQYAIKLAFCLTMPISTPLFVYSSDYLSFMGEDYRMAGITLSILLVGLPFSIITEMIYYLVYARGENKTLLYLGLVGNIPRVLLYFTLIPFMGSNGASLAYVIGTVCQLLFSIRISRSYSLELDFLKYITLTIIPISIGLIMWFTKVEFLIASSIIVITSFLFYIGIRYLTEREISMILNVVFPGSKGKKISTIICKIVKMIGR